MRRNGSFINRDVAPSPTGGAVGVWPLSELHEHIKALRWPIAGAFTTWDPANKGSGITLSNGNLTSIGSGSWYCVRSVASTSSGKRYYEFPFGAVSSGNDYLPGISKAGANFSSYLGGDANGWSWQAAYGTPRTINNGGFPTYGAQCVAGDVVGVLLDLTAGTLTYTKNGVSQGVAFSGLSGTFFAAIGHLATVAITTRFSRPSWTYDPGAGYEPWG